jgi:uncharacterized protein YuzE
MPETTYDPTTGAVYIYAVEKWGDERKVRTQDLGSHVYADFDVETGELLGIEIVSLDGLKRSATVLEQ